MLPIRSLNNNESAYVQFQNRTLRNVDIVWINYSGNLRKYTTLQPREDINIDTYETHPWIFVDHQTGLKMRVGVHTIFYPLSNRQLLRRLGFNHGENYPVRASIPISLPLFTLRDISVQTVVKLLKDENDVERLELPRSLVRDIKRFFQQKNQILSMYES